MTIIVLTKVYELNHACIYRLTVYRIRNLPYHRLQRYTSIHEVIVILIEHAHALNIAKHTVKINIVKFYDVYVRTVTKSYCKCYCNI